MTGAETGQASDSVAQNSEFFARDTYPEHARNLDSHARIQRVLTEELRGSGRLLDVGNGGVFEYELDVAEEILGVDLFLDESMSASYPAHVTLRRGDALELDEPEESWDVVLEGFLYHHLTGSRPEDSITNTRRAIAEAVRVLKPGGRLVIVESCIPRSLYPLERALFRPLRRLAATRLLGGHPATLQLPIEVLLGLVSERIPIERTAPIPLGRWVTQFGRRFPTALTPVRAHLIVARKPA